MKKIISKSWIFLAIFTLLIQACVPTTKLEVPVEQSFSTTITVQSTNAEFSKSASVYSLSSDFEQIVSNNNLESISSIQLQAVNYRIIANSSSDGTILNGNIKVKLNEDGISKNLLNLNNVDPQSELKVNHVAVLDTEGVMVVNSFLNNYQAPNDPDDESFTLYYILDGTATSSGDINTDFSLSLTLVVSVVGIVTK